MCWTARRSHEVQRARVGGSELKETTRSYLPALNLRTGAVCAYAPHAEHVPGASRLFLASGGKRENANYFLRISLRIFRFPLLFPSAWSRLPW